MDSRDIAKRIFDVVFAAVSVILLSPFILLALISIFLENLFHLRAFDPLIYRETRISKGEAFEIYKFNIFKSGDIDTFRQNHVFIHTKKLEHNDGITLVGWFLKQIYMDELPQLWNVLKGDMSIVGPRPVNPVVYQKLMDQEITAKSLIKAGLTGSFQSFKDSKGMLSAWLDQEYVNYYFKNPWYKILIYDLGIILRTIKVILLARGV